MKSITLLLLIGCLFSIIYTAKYCGDLGKDAEGNDIYPSKKEDCTSYKQSDYEKAEGDSCCYLVRTIGEKESKRCRIFNKKYITKDFIENYIKEYNIDISDETRKMTSIFTFLVFIF